MGQREENEISGGSLLFRVSHPMCVMGCNALLTGNLTNPPCIAWTEEKAGGGFSTAYIFLYLRSHGLLGTKHQGAGLAHTT